MKYYILDYRVKIKAKDENAAELLSVDLEGEIMGLHKDIQWVNGDPYMEEVDE